MLRTIPTDLREWFYRNYLSKDVNPDCYGIYQTVRGFHGFFEEAEHYPDYVTLAESGELNLLRWIHRYVSRSHHFVDRILEAAVMNGNFHIADWLMDLGFRDNVRNINYFKALCTFGVPVIQWMYERKIPPSYDYCQVAAIRNDTKILEWLDAHGLLQVSSCAHHAILLESKIIMEWILDKGYHLNYNTVNFALRHANTWESIVLKSHSSTNQPINIALRQGGASEFTDWLQKELHIHGYLVEKYITNLQ